MIWGPAHTIGAMSAPPVCANCGARSPERSARFCGFCGHELPREASAPPPSPFGDLPARFAALQAHPDYHAAQDHEPPTTRHHVAHGGAMAGLVFFILVALGMAAFMSQVFGPMALVPLAMAGFAFFALIRTASRASEFAGARLRRLPALVVGERTSVSGGGENRRARTHYYVTLEFPEGGREEYQADGELVGRLTQGDMGVAFLKASTLLAFERVPGV